MRAEAVDVLSDGARMVVEISASLLRDDRESGIGCLEIIRDISGARSQEPNGASVVQNRRLPAASAPAPFSVTGSVLESFLANMPAPAFVKDEQGRYFFANKALSALMPALANCLGKTDEELFGAERAEAFRNSDVAALKSGQPIRTVEPLRVGDEERSFLSIRFPIVNPSGSRMVSGVLMDITDRVRDQAELRKQYALLDCANDAIFTTTLDGIITYWNQGAERLYGWTAGEALGKNEMGLLCAEFSRPYSELMEQFLREGKWEGEARRVRKGGEPLTVSSNWSLLCDLHGVPIARLVINTDLTETKIAFDEVRVAEAEAQARANELQAILDAIPGATFIAHDRECRTMISSREAYKLLRLPYGANTSKSASNEELPTAFRLMKDGREIAVEDLPVQRAAATGQPVLNFELTIVFNDGTSVDVLGNAVPLTDGEGSVRGAVGSFVDVTERNRALQSARRDEAILKTVLDSIPDRFFLKDCDGKYVAINSAGALAAGKTPEEFIGKDDMEVFPPEVAAVHQARDRAVLNSGEPAVYEDETVFHNEVRYLQTVKNVCRSADGRLLGVVGVTRDITDRKRNEMELQLSENRYRSLVRASSSLVWTADVDGRPKGDLTEWRELTGLSIRAVTERGGIGSIHPDDMERSVASWKENIAKGEPFEIEHRIRHRDGEYRVMRGRAVPVRDASGSIVEWVGMETDVTEQRTSEQALRESELRFRRLFESDLMGIGNPTASGLITNANDELLRITGYSREDLDAGLVRWDTMTPPEYREIDQFHIAEAVERGSCTPYEKEYIRKDGSRVPILCGYAVLGGDRDAFIGFIQDLTVQKQAEAALREREQRFSALAESLPQLIWVTSMDGETIYRNGGCRDYLGAALEHAAGTNWLSVVHPDDIKETGERWDKSMSSGDAFLSEFRLRRHDGEFRYFVGRAVAVRAASGSIERWVTICTDVHEQKLTEQASRTSEKLAVASRLSASLAHAINNPLASVTNALYLTQFDKSLSDESRRLLQVAEQELARVALVTKQALQFHKQTTAASRIDLGRVMNSALSVFGERFRSCRITVEREYRAQQEFYCYGDGLRQVFAHLISNSFDALSGGGRLRIRISESRSWDGTGMRGIRVTVADTGAGIPEDLRRHLFEAFTSTKDPAGAGLGLWVAQGIVQKHQGHIAVRSSTNAKHHGTVVMVFLPFIREGE